MSSISLLFLGDKIREEWSQDVLYVLVKRYNLLTMGGSHAQHS